MIWKKEEKAVERYVFEGRHCLKHRKKDGLGLVDRGMLGNGLKTAPGDALEDSELV